MTNKKNMLILFLGLMLLLVSASYASAASVLSVSLSKYDPYPATPGQTVKVYMLVQNIGDSETKNINVELVPEFPFSLYGDSANKSISILGANRDYLIDYNLKVDSNALQGDNNLKVKLTFSSNANVESITEKNVDVYVQSRDSTLTINSIKLEPTELTPGSDGKITITIKNTAPASLTDLNLKLFLQAQVGGILIDLPFAPMDSASEKKIYKLDPDQTAEFTFKLRAYPDATSKIYKIPFLLTYYDSLSNLKNKSDYVGVVVNSVPEIKVLVDKTDMSLQKRSGSVTLKFVNKGLSDTKFLTATLLKSDDYELLSNTDTNYIGNLVSDDYQTLEYKIGLKNAKDVINMPVRIEYRDANNNVYDKTENVELKLIDSDKLTAANKSASGSITIVLIVIIVIAVLIFLYFRRRNKKNKKAQF